MAKKNALDAWANAPQEPQASASDLKKVATLAKKQLELEGRILKVAERMKALNEELRVVKEVDLPLAMQDCGLATFTLENGAKVEVAKQYYASLTGQYREPALAWLRANKLDELISFDITASFGKGQRRQFEALLKKLKAIKKNAPAVAGQENVNTTSFKAVVRERLEQGKPVPVAEIGVTVIDGAKITLPKKKQGL